MSHCPVSSPLEPLFQERFEENSEISLTGFLREDKYEAVCAALREADLKWAKRGPAHKRNYQAMAEKGRGADKGFSDAAAAI